MRLALDFVAEFVIAGRATIAPSVAAHVLRHLAAGVPSHNALPQQQQQQRPPGASHAQAEQAERQEHVVVSEDGHQEGPPAAAGVGETPGAEETLREAAEERFLGVMAGGGFGGEAAPAPNLAAAALDLATRAGFLRAQARVGGHSPWCLFGNVVSRLAGLGGCLPLTHLHTKHCRQCVWFDILLSKLLTKALATGLKAIYSLMSWGPYDACGSCSADLALALTDLAVL